jgi:hypothetical protein
MFYICMNGGGEKPEIQKLEWFYLIILRLTHFLTNFIESDIL